MAQTSELNARPEAMVSYGSAYTFDPFTRHQFYTEINRSLVEHAVGLLDDANPHGAQVRVVELASGTGNITELVLDALERRGRPATVVGVEPSADAIDVAEQRLAGRPVTFLQGDAADLGRAIGKADAVLFLNAIHLVPDKDAAVAEIASVLHPGGFFAANSAFYNGTYPAGTERFYHLWIRRALGWMRQQHPDVRPSHHGKTPAMQWLSPDDYDAVLRRQGLELAFQETEQVQMPLRAWQDIGRYSLFIEGALPGVPVPVGADALEFAAAQAFEELQLNVVPRNWLQMVARKR
jgi:ubiquinone/menaquinone biosynthesis C-methylase UbiE